MVVSADYYCAAVDWLTDTHQRERDGTVYLSDLIGCIVFILLQSQILQLVRRREFHAFDFSLEGSALLYMRKSIVANLHKITISLYLL